MPRRCNCYYSVGKFLTLSEKEWLRTMNRNAPTPPTKGQIKAWVDSFHVLQKTLASMPTECHNLYILFEYALPYFPIKPGGTLRPYYVYADAILLSRNKSVVLEFKQMDQPYFGHARQARKYRRRIQDFHDASRGMCKGAILVLTKAKNLRREYHKVDCCSSDLLANVIAEQFNSDYSRHPDVNAWCNSTFAGNPLPPN